MKGNEPVLATPSPRQATSSRRPGKKTRTHQPAAEAIWLCPAVPSLTGAEIAAALYAGSSLMDEVRSSVTEGTVQLAFRVQADAESRRVEGRDSYLAMSGDAVVEQERREHGHDAVGLRRHSRTAELV